jgi:hypothetical protein
MTADTQRPLDVNDALAGALTENARLRQELARWESGQRRKGTLVVESVPDGLRYAAELVRAQGTEGGEGHDELLVAAAQRLKGLHDAAGHLLAEAVANRAERDSLAARLADAERVVEAAKAWVASIVDPPNAWADDADFALIAAVDAYQSTRAGETDLQDAINATLGRMSAVRAPTDPPLVLGDQVLVDQPKETS